MLRRADISASQAPSGEYAAAHESEAALLEAYWGDATSARLHALKALKLSRNKNIEHLAAYTLALGRDFSHVEAVADDLERRFPNDTLVQSNEVPTLRALLALNSKNPAKAIELLQVTTPVELGSFPDPIYVRGNAFLALHRGPEAAAEFQKILDHRGIVTNDPSGALAHLQLARAYVLSGERSKAKVAYQDFLGLWKNADPDLAILAQAKTEYATLL